MKTELLIAWINRAMVFHEKNWTDMDARYPYAYKERCLKATKPGDVPMSVTDLEIAKCLFSSYWNECQLWEAQYKEQGRLK